MRSRKDAKITGVLWVFPLSVSESVQDSSMYPTHTGFLLSKTETHASKTIEPKRSHPFLASLAPWREKPLFLVSSAGKIPTLRRQGRFFADSVH